MRELLDAGRSVGLGRADKTVMVNLLHRVRLLVLQGQETEALALVDELLAGRPRHLETLLLKASLLMQNRADAEALSVCRRAVDVEPKSAEAQNALARCLHHLGVQEEALCTAQRARELLALGDNYRQVAPVYLTLVWCLRRAGRSREALALAEEGLQRAPDAVLAQWASVVEQELAEQEKERC